MLPGRPRHVEGARQVDLQHGLEQVGREIVKGTVAEDAGVVHDYVDPTERLDRPLHHRGPLFRRRDAVVVGDRLAPCSSDLLDHQVGRARAAATPRDVSADVVDHDARPAPRQLQRMGAAQAPAGAGHDGDVAVEAQLCHRAPYTIV
jgi:hypothetical protein